MEPDVDLNGPDAWVYETPETEEPWEREPTDRDEE